MIEILAWGVVIYFGVIGLILLYCSLFSAVDKNKKAEDWQIKDFHQHVRFAIRALQKGGK